jgi:hypothetical protein
VWSLCGTSDPKGCPDFQTWFLPFLKRLADGRQLADLMFEFDLGASPVTAYEVKRVDTDFFEESQRNAPLNVDPLALQRHPSI